MPDAAKVPMPHKVQVEFSMGADTKLFTPGDKESSAYRNLRTNTTTPEAIAGREFAEKLWEQYHPYADSNFLIEIRRDFHARFWEMYLTCALLKCSLQREYSVSCPKSKAGGPDIRIEHSGQCIWVEAVTATDGDSDKPDSIITPTLGKVYDVPDERIILRYMTAIEQKYHKYREHRQNGIVNKGDSYIIAVNGYPLSYRWSDAEMLRILKAVFPIGALQFVFDRIRARRRQDPGRRPAYRLRRGDRRDGARWRVRTLRRRRDQRPFAKQSCQFYDERATPVCARGTGREADEGVRRWAGR
jgi:hypothetical protein